jgi:SNF1-activating kinase 1
VHYQGIIHRDIKPANLLWTEDRQQVKISDFGVSHFSAALAAAGSAQATSNKPKDPNIDADLLKRAGTPSFLAPEIVYEYKHENLPSYARSDKPPFASSEESTNSEHSTSTLNLPLAKPLVTKAIDVWALGITLYCLLFGHVPFHYSGDNAFRTYVLIANSDWGVEETMGFDRVATRGRHPRPNDQSEGAIIINILDKMLQKEARDRMTLDEFKVSVSRCQVATVVLT